MLFCDITVVDPVLVNPVIFPKKYKRSILDQFNTREFNSKILD